MLKGSDFLKLGILNTGGECKVPNNKLAKIMYYLQCVFTILDVPGYEHYTNYKNYSALTRRQIQDVLVLALRFEPSLMISYNLFIVDKDLIPLGFGNQFYERTDRRLPYSCRSEVLIGGKGFKVLNIMACTQAWINQNYNEPMDLFASTCCCYCCDRKRRKCCKRCLCISCILICLSFIVITILALVD